MTDFDKQRIENAIWILQQYEDEVREFAVIESCFDSWDCDKLFDILDTVKKQLTGE